MFDNSKMSWIAALLCVFISTVSIGVQAQGILFEEDFSGGFPAGWATVDTSGSNRLWSYCADPTNQTPANPGETIGCHSIWDDSLNLQGPFASSTAANGFMTVDSDADGGVHVSQLTTPPLNFSGQATVHLQFQSHIGVFSNDAETNAIVQVSSNGGGTWTDFTVFPGLVPGTPAPPLVRWSYNPTVVDIDISAVAANQPSVLIRWHWNANYEYHWDLDDIVIYDTVVPVELMSFSVE